jgi:predicted helicase
MNLHINYETITPYDLIIEMADNGTAIIDLEKLQKAKLKADKINSTIKLDVTTVLRGVPKMAWEYKLGTAAHLSGYSINTKKRNHQTQPSQKSSILQICRLQRLRD